MGDWTIHIEGHGIHDNGRADDADELLKEFVRKLEEQHEVYSATLTVGSARHIIRHGDEVLLGRRLQPGERP